MNSMTAYDASFKWCPFANYAGSNRTGDANHYDTNPEECRCQADDCMAWRWLGADEDGNGQSYGYCGLAGSPFHPLQVARIASGAASS